MSVRYVVRRSDSSEPRYMVWDSERSGVAVSLGRECINLSFDEALNTAEMLNAPAARPLGAPEPIQPAQQQQQPQPKKE